jgi:lathosterol oxidase
MAPFIPSVEALAWAALFGGRPSPALNTVQHHDLHHRYPKVHFSLYMTHWDRWLGTEHPEYRSMVEGLGGKGAAAAAPPAEGRARAGET